MRIIIGAVVSLPPFSPGLAWTWMQFVVGLQRLGHEVYYIEELEPEWSVDDRGNPCPLSCSVNRRRFCSVMQQFGLAGRATQLVRGEDANDDSVLRSILDASPDLLINMAGHVTSARVLERVPRRAYFDQDPVYTQLWRDEYKKDLNFAAHDVFLTVGLNIGTDRTRIPDCGRHWHRAFPPVVLDLWDMAESGDDAPFTTIATWSGFSELCFEGRWYRSKHEEFVRFAALPRQVAQPLEIALRWYPSEAEEIDVMRIHGWRISESSRIDSLSDYQTFIGRSRAEIGIAKHAYVLARSGWFSDRSSHYLAAGRPVLAQATGFEDLVPTGKGLLAFRTLAEAVDGIDAINGDYAAHAHAARAFAETYLDYRCVLPPLLDACMT